MKRAIIALTVLAAGCAATPETLSVRTVSPLRIADAARIGLVVHTTAMIFRPLGPGEDKDPRRVSAHGLWLDRRDEHGEGVHLDEKRPGTIVGVGAYWVDVEFEPGGVLRFQHCPALFGWDRYRLHCEPPSDAPRFVDYRGTRFEVLWDSSLDVMPAELERLKKGGA